MKSKQWLFIENTKKVDFVIFMVFAILNLEFQNSAGYTASFLGIKEEDYINRFGLTTQDIIFIKDCWKKKLSIMCKDPIGVFDKLITGFLPLGKLSKYRKLYKELAPRYQTTI